MVLRRVLLLCCESPGGLGVPELSQRGAEFALTQRFAGPQLPPTGCVLEAPPLMVRLRNDLGYGDALALPVHGHVGQVGA